MDEAQNPTVQDLLHGQLGGYVYAPALFRQRLQEELLRSNRTGRPFLYVRIPTRLFDLLGHARSETDALRAWKISTLTLLTQSDVLDVKGYLENGAGLGLIFLDSDHTLLQELRRKMLRNLREAGLLEALRLRPKRPIFEVHYYSAQVEASHLSTAQVMERFELNNEGFFVVHPLNYSALQDGGLISQALGGIKRLIDIGGALLGIIGLSPLLIFLALMVKWSDSKGSVIFRQKRVGLNGKTFTMFKFRSMYMDAEKRLADLKHLNETSGPVFKMKNDPRIFPFGRLIRRYSLDELPQLFNILWGDMSIVGPRPPIPSEVLQYEPWHKMRLSVKPGLTCYWQVSGRSEIGFEDWMRLDNKYVRHGDLKSDIALIGKTFLTVVRGDGAY